MWWANGASPASTPPQAYLSSVWDIPILRQKSQYVVEHCDFIRGSYKDKMLHFVLQAYPRDELFEIAAPALADTAEGMVSLNERPRVRLFARTDHFKRYVSAIVYLPREQFNTELRQRVRRHLAEALAATESDFAVQLLGQSPLARLHFGSAPTPLPCPTSTPPRWSKTSTPWCAAGTAIGSSWPPSKA